MLADTADPVVYTYYTGHGGISTVAYHNGAVTKTAKFQYNTCLLTKLLDWRHATNGITYAYDDAGRLTKETDQVRATKTFAVRGSPTPHLLRP